MNRAIGLLTFLLMLVANAVLLVKDILPRLSAGKPPLPREMALIPGEELQSQQALTNEQGQVIGAIWSISSRSVEILATRTWTVLEPMALGPGLTLPRLQVMHESIFDKNCQLDEINLRVFGFGVPVWVKGQFAPPGDFPIQWQLDDRRGTINLPAETAAAMRDAMQPLGSLTQLEVGQAWRVRIMNPIASLTPGMKGDLQTLDMLVRVTGKTKLEHNGEKKEVFVVETDSLVAFVDQDGRLLKQVMEIPLLGQVTCIDVPFDDAARRKAVIESRK